MRKFTNIQVNNTGTSILHFAEFKDFIIIEGAVYDKYTLEYKTGFNINRKYAGRQSWYSWDVYYGLFSLYRGFYNHDHHKGNIVNAIDWGVSNTPLRYLGYDKNPLIMSLNYDGKNFHHSDYCSYYSNEFIVDDTGEYVVSYNVYNYHSHMRIATDQALSENSYNSIIDHTDYSYCKLYNINEINDVESSITVSFNGINYFFSNIVKYDENTIDPYYLIFTQGNIYTKLYKYYRKSNSVEYYTYVPSGNESSNILPVQSSDGTYVNPSTTRQVQSLPTHDLIIDNNRSVCLMNSLFNNVDNDTIYIDLPEDVYGTSSTSGTYGDISNDEHHRSYPYLHMIDMNHDTLEYTNYMLDVDWSVYSDYDYFDPTDTDSRIYSYSKNIFFDGYTTSQDSYGKCMTRSFITTFNDVDYLIAFFLMGDGYCNTKMMCCTFTFDIDNKTATLVDLPYIYIDYPGENRLSIYPINEELNKFAFTSLKSGSYNECDVMLNLSWTPDTGWVATNMKNEYNNNGWIYIDSLDRIWSINSKYELSVGKLDDNVLINIDSYSDIEWSGDDIIKTYKFDAKDLLGSILSDTDFEIDIKTTNSTVTFSDGTLSQTITTDSNGLGLFDLLITGVNEFELIINKA